MRDFRGWRGPALLVFALAIGGAAAQPAIAAGPPPGYKLVWKDEFNREPGMPPDPAVWTHETGASGWGNNELQNYVVDDAHSHVVADPAATDKRALQILVTSPSAGHYESARLITGRKLSVQYGYVEARIRLPAGQGIWPAFWMLGEDLFDRHVGWPECGEIDIMENIGKDPWLGKNRSSLHGPGYSGGASLHADFDLPAGAAFRDRYHLFAMLWTKDAITFSVDGKAFSTQRPADAAGKPWVFDRPFFLIANVAVGGSFPGSPDATTRFPQEMRIDYIRVYQKPGTGAILILPQGK
jgi:beta-glucanase (GH16 family)